MIDVQVGWMSGEYAVSGAGVLRTTLVAALEAARSSGSLVVFLQDVGNLDSSVPQDSPGRALVFEPGPGEVQVPKEADDGFVGTDLLEVLRAAGVSTVAVAGIQSEMCVAATARGALARGFGVVLPRDAHATGDIPADGAASGVPAAQVSRVAEWSLGDEVVVVDRIADVVFEPRRT